MDIYIKRCAYQRTSQTLCEDPCEGRAAEAEKDFLLPWPLARVLRHFYYHTEFHLIHRSAIEFLKRDSRAKTFMAQANAGIGSRDEKIFQASQFGLKIQSYLLKQVYQSNYRHTTNVNVEHSLGLKLERNICAYFFDQNRVMMTSMVSYLSREFPESKFAHLDAIGSWYVQEAQDLHKYMPAYHLDIRPSLPFTGPLPPDQLFYGNVAAYGEGQYVLGKMPSNPEVEAPFYFKVAISYLRHLCLQNILDASMIPYLQIVERCLQSGLDPNLYHSAYHDTAWRGFLGWILECEFMIEGTVLPPVFEHILALVSTFYDHGAQEDTLVFHELNVDNDRHVTGWCDWSIHIDISSVSLLAYLRFCVETGVRCLWRPLYRDEPSGNSVVLSILLCSSQDSVSWRMTDCRRFSISQQSEILTAVGPALAQSFRVWCKDSKQSALARERLDISLDRLRPMLERIWEENQSSIVEVDSSQRKKRRTLPKPNVCT